MAVRPGVLVLRAIEDDRCDVTRGTTDGNLEAVRAPRVDRIGTCRCGNRKAEHHGPAPEGERE